MARCITRLTELDPFRRGVFHLGKHGPVGGPDPERRSYASFVWFSDPDGNDWLLQEVTIRLPGRVEARSSEP